jgi:hypothetical protein
MVNLFTGESSNDLFGGDVPPFARALVDRARQASNAEQALAILWTAQVCAPDCPSLYYLLYKFHARHGDFIQAEQVASKGLEIAAAQAGLPMNWQLVTPDMADFQTPGPARFWLFTLKALAFLRLKQHDAHGARLYLNQVQRFDPHGGVGADVIAALIAGSQGS